MRVDKFLKYSGIVKRRTLAKRLCDGGLITINGNRAKPGSAVRIGDVISVQVGMNRSEYEVLALMDHEVRRSERDQYSRRLSAERLDPRDEI